MSEWHIFVIGVYAPPIMYCLYKAIRARKP